MTGPRDPAAAGRDRLRAGHADREQAVETLKAAFVDGRLTRDELGARAGRALAARTHADLAALTADIPAGPARPPAPVRRRPLARAAAGSGTCLTIAATAVWGAFTLDPGPPASGPDGYGAGLMLLLAIYAVLAALGFLIAGMNTALKQRRSRGQLPPRPGPGDHAREGERQGGTGHVPVPPGPRTGQTRADLRAHVSRQRRRHFPARAGRAARGVRPAPGAVTPARPAPGPVPARLPGLGLTS